MLWQEAENQYIFYRELIWIKEGLFDVNAYPGLCLPLPLYRDAISGAYPARGQKLFGPQFINIAAGMREMHHQAGNIFASQANSI